MRRLGPSRRGEPSVKGDIAVWWSDVSVLMIEAHDKFWAMCFNDYTVFLLATSTSTKPANRWEHRVNRSDPRKRSFSDETGSVRHLEVILP